MSLLRTAAAAVFTTVAVVYTTAVYLFLRCYDVLMLPMLLVIRLGWDRHLFAHRWKVVIFFHGMVLLLVSSVGRSLFADVPFGFAWHVAAISLFAGPFALTVDRGMMSEIPSRFDEVRRIVAERFPERYFARWLPNPLDAIFLRQVLLVALLIVPTFALLWLPSQLSVFTVLYFVACVQLPGYILTKVDHTQIHNRVLGPGPAARGAGRWAAMSLQFLWDYVLMGMAGHIPNYYRVQHIGVHHVEDNSLEDTQTTLTKDRSSYVDFCRMALEQSLSRVLAVDIARYLSRKHRTPQLKLLIKSVLGFWVVWAFAAWVSWPAALVVLGVTFMSGIFEADSAFHWHGLVDPERPDDLYRNTANADFGDDHGQLGALLHIAHHEFPAQHWSALIRDHVATEAKRRDAATLTFKNLGNDLLRALWGGQVERLTRIYSFADGRPTTLENTTELLKTWTVPIVARPRTRLADFVDRTLGRFVANYLLS